MQLNETTGLDPNCLPYFVTDSVGDRVPVAFASVAEADTAELSGEDWAGALFLDVWREYIEHSDARTVKLVTTDIVMPILGLLRMGNVIEGSQSLKRSLLETAPVFRRQWQSPPPTLRGVGRVLVARLVMESYNQGAGGAVRVRAHPRATGFYRRIGFREVDAVTNSYVLPREEAETFFQKATR